MNIHEYQGKQIFQRYGVPTPKGIPAFTVPEAAAAAKQLISDTGNEVVVVKAQIHAGGRGKAGGVKVVKGAAAAEEAAKALLGATLVTPQTGPKGKVVQRLYVEQGLAIEREIYMAMLVDREVRRVLFMASTEGGVEIEKVAEETPEKILKVWIDPATGLMPYQARKIGFALGLSGKTLNQFSAMAGKLYEMFVAEDCSMVEVNPFCVLKDGTAVALDAKVNFDENASFRHKEWEDLRDASEENAVETAAKQAGLSYVALDGNIGCLVNGAGLAMSTMDIIKHFGGQPANFLDVGGGATKEQVTEAFTIITKDPSVRGIFVNIFGGIMKCDVIAAGVIAATKAVGLKVPLVVRLEGTNVELGRKMLEESGLAITPANDMKDGAQKIVALAGKG
ncbi:ADP-forming succinate--CoA ligase subunit beta [Sandaracinus amylolyticus]|uniref:Succinate--CoA ligase [ADP-forming] subunit beta n=1 Tax=Sandaracinus amylolyticus TaxID=927083 RepID=A0A0F6W3G9_9BACT|nr:ADP-forming succinate--CoA ligase subunit beta [Sandaracinus amylolyticus]AKF06531.1 Succinyl-CoA ligase [ADP-forming] beta chain [Sandaracinus amylolyticus]